MRAELIEKIRRVGEEVFTAGETDAAVVLGTLVNALRQGKEVRLADACADLAVKDWGGLGAPLGRATDTALLSVNTEARQD